MSFEIRIGTAILYASISRQMEWQRGIWRHDDGNTTYALNFGPLYFNVIRQKGSR
jgi:hypothetical protein